LLRATDVSIARIAGNSAHDIKFAVEWRDRNTWQHDGSGRSIVTQRDDNGAAIHRGIVRNESELILVGSVAGDPSRMLLPASDSQDLGEVDADCRIERTHGGCDPNACD
jgi:hypothetical protein